MPAGARAQDPRHLGSRQAPLGARRWERSSVEASGQEHRHRRSRQESEPRLSSRASRLNIGPGCGQAERNRTLTSELAFRGRRAIQSSGRPSAEVEAAGRRTGELAWRLPLHAEYAELIKSRYADIANAVEARKAGSITAAEFLRRFTGDVPWAHVDIAGTAYENGKPYTPKGGSGFGVRLLVELARANGGAPDVH